MEKHLEPTAGPKAVYQDKTCILFSVRGATGQPVRQLAYHSSCLESAAPYSLLQF